MRKNLLPVLVSVLLAACVSGSAYGAMWYVDDSVPASGDGTSWGTAFKTIQEGIDAAEGGDEVIVAEGTYLENIEFAGKNIAVHTVDPLGPEVVANTTIDGGQLGSVVTFAGTEDATCGLSGFTITNGDAEAGGGICGGEWTLHTRASIRNNVIVGNSSSSGGGIAFCDGVIENNLFVGNSADYWGGGLHDCDGFVQNNTVVANSSGLIGGGISDCTGTIRNCIIWGNTALIEQQIYGSTATYSCIQGWVGPGTGNINADPLFVNPAEDDYRLSPGSPCVDAGINAEGLPATDLDGNSRLVDGDSDGEAIVDMGAFEFQVAPAPEPDIEVSPASFDFGEVVLGASATAIVTITNAGDGDLHVGEVSVGGSGDFQITSCPTLPVAIEPFSVGTEVEITYSPSVAGPASATLAISSDDPDEPVAEVALSGTGLAPEQSPPEQIAEILEFFDQSVKEDSLKGDGPGKSAKGRLNALENMLEVARALIRGGHYEEACQQLFDVYRRTDGVRRPPDFVIGPAAAELAEMILELMDTLTGE